MEIASISPTIVNPVNNLLEKYYNLSNQKSALDKKLFYYTTFNFSPKYDQLFYNAFFNRGLNNMKQDFNNPIEKNYLLYGLGLMKSTAVKPIYEHFEKKKKYENYEDIKFDFFSSFAMARTNEITDYKNFQTFSNFELMVSCILHN